MYTPTTSELLGERDVFFGQYFNQRPVLRRGALRANPRDVISVVDLDSILCSPAIRPPYLDIAKDGRQVPRSAYTEPIVVQSEYVTDRVVPARVAAHVRAGATLVWNSLQHYRPNLRALAGELSNVFAARTDVIGFLTPAGRRGLAPHFDPVDVFVVQIEGSKSWRVWPVPAQRRGDDRGNLNEAELGTPAVEATLQPGDVLYMPYNCAHVATSEGRMSLHLSVTVAPRRWSALLQDIVANLVQEDPTFWGNPWLRDREFGMELPAMLSRLADRLHHIDAAAEVERMIADGIDPDGVEMGSHLQDAASADFVDPATVLARVESVRIEEIKRDGDKVTARIDGAVYSLPAGVGDALDSLAGGGSLDAGSLLRGASTDLSTRTARMLIRIGVLRSIGVPKHQTETGATV